MVQALMFQYWRSFTSNEGGFGPQLRGQDPRTFPKEVSRAIFMSKIKEHSRPPKSLGGQILIPTASQPWNEWDKTMDNQSEESINGEKGNLYDGTSKWWTRDKGNRQRNGADNTRHNDDGECALWKLVDREAKWRPWNEDQKCKRIFLYRLIIGNTVVSVNGYRSTIRFRSTVSFFPSFLFSSLFPLPLPFSGPSFTTLIHLFCQREERKKNILISSYIFSFPRGEEKDRIDRGTVNITRSENDSVSGKENYESCVYDKSDDI